MKSIIKLISVKDMSPEDWLKYRKKGIGASEVGIIMGLSRYKSSIELFYEKIGEGLNYTVENIAMFLGKEQEEFIATMWEFWEGDQESMIKNYRAGKVIRRCKRVNAYAHNDKYPWLFASLDFEVNKHDGKGNGTLETKTIGSFEANKWQSGIPPGYVVQVQTQMLVCEMLYGEIAILKDNRDFMVYPFEYHADICNSIIETTGTFWKKVEKAKEVATKRFEAERTFNYRQAQELTAELQSLEPSPDGSDAYNNFLKEKYQIAQPGERKGSIEELTEAEAHKKLAEEIKVLEEKKQLHENRLKASMRDQCDKLEFGVNGWLSWKANKTGSRVFLNKVKNG